MRSTSAPVCSTPYVSVSMAVSFACTVSGAAKPMAVDEIRKAALTATLQICLNMKFPPQPYNYLNAIVHPRLEIPMKN